jgi:uncharacterized paraquat-inducible protein A
MLSYPTKIVLVFLLVCLFGGFAIGYYLPAIIGIPLSAIVSFGFGLLMSRIVRKHNPQKVLDELVAESQVMGLYSTPSRKCKLCGRTNTHRTNSTCPGDWEDI